MGASIIIAAAGSATRMGKVDKISYKLCGKEVVGYCIEAFAMAECTDKIVVVTSPDKLNEVKSTAEKYSHGVETEVVIGAETRQGSVFRGLERCNDSDCVMIHDAARPMITSELVDKLYSEITENKKAAAALAVKVKDTVKVADGNGKIERTLPREKLFSVQTPQAFLMSLYKKAVKKALDEKKEYTDDCQLVESLGESVYLVGGDYRNIKITTPEDLLTAEVFLKEKNKCYE